MQTYHERADKNPQAREDTNRKNRLKARLKRATGKAVYVYKKGNVYTVHLSDRVTRDSHSHIFSGLDVFELYVTDVERGGPQ